MEEVIKVREEGNVNQGLRDGSAPRARAEQVIIFMDAFSDKDRIPPNGADAVSQLFGTVEIHFFP
jgi:hypothetical protein